MHDDNNVGNNDAMVAKILAQLGQQPQSNNVVVKYSGPIPADLKSELEVHLKMKFPTADEVKFVEDASLIAGVQIMYKDYLYDDTVGSRFAGLRKTLS